MLTLISAGVSISSQGQSSSTSIPFSSPLFMMSLIVCCNQVVPLLGLLAMMISPDMHGDKECQCKNACHQFKLRSQDLRLILNFNFMIPQLQKCAYTHASLKFLNNGTKLFNTWIGFCSAHHLRNIPGHHARCQ